MVRLFASGIRIIVFALMALTVLAVKYPWEAGACALAFALLALYGQKLRRDRVYSLDVAHMSPVEYEQHCAEVLRRAGWSVRHVGRLGDQGVDVIAEIRGIKAAIQCKRYAGRAGNDAVQQAVAGKRIYGAQIAVVVAPRGFTRAAQQLADSNAAFLMSHADLAGLERVARVP